MILSIAILIFNLVVIVLLFKTENAYKNQKKVLNAMDSYAKASADNLSTALIMLDEMEDFYITLFRFWDWGYKNILPKKYLELLEPYIR